MSVEVAHVSEAQEILLALPAPVAMDVAALVQMMDYAALRELVCLLCQQVDESAKHPGWDRMMDLTTRARAGKVRTPVMAKMSVSPKRR